MNVFKLDERANTSTFYYNNYEDARYNLASTVMYDFLKVAIINEAIRQQVMNEIQQNGNHLVWSAKDKNVHYLARA